MKGGSRMKRIPHLILSAVVPPALFLSVLGILPDTCSAERFRFVFMTDIHVTEEFDGDEGFRAAARHVNSLGPDFVITGGDMVMDALGVSFAEAVEAYDLYASICEDLEAPVHHGIGNHEIFGLYDTTGTARENEEYLKGMFRKRLGDGATSSAFDHGGWHFILLDVIGFSKDGRYMGYAGKEQLRWLEDDLKGVRPGTPIVLSLHIPLVSVYGQVKRGSCTALTPGEAVLNSDEVLDLFERHDLRLVLQGHLHVVEQIAFKGTHFVTGGAVCGAWWEGARDGFPEGFVVVDIDGDEMDYHYETYGWEASEDLPDD
ncbi:MAG TPA: metallophosphoesterase [Candidatus Krumholzibacterium sp.]|nr:metallophosphoesterase [Candidatus Krumholzibacterium sp.]